MRLISIFIVISALAFNQRFVKLENQATCNSLGEEWKREILCDSVPQSYTRGMGCNVKEKGLKKSNVIEPPVWWCYSRTLLWPVEQVPTGAESMLVKYQYKNTVPWFKASLQASQGGPVHLGCSTVCVLPLIQVTNRALQLDGMLQFFFLIHYVSFAWFLHTKLMKKYPSIIFLTFNISLYFQVHECYVVYSNCFTG